jgi:acetyl-CoA carboxylase carboxyl transferase subunit alpha
MNEEYTLDFERPLVELERQIAELKALAGQGAEFEADLARLEEKARRLQREIFGALEPWQKVQLSRHPRRPYLLDYVPHLFTEFLELRGDRVFADDPAIVAGLALFHGEPVVVLGHQKGRGTKENMVRNFGMPRPEGYRKARRLMDLADRFGRPILSFIDTPGAYPGIGAEERGQAEAIATNLLRMADLGVPMISVVLGEGGSGGALAIGMGNRVLMLEYAIYSVISPEGCASILWKDASRAPEAAAALRLTARDLFDLGVVDEVVPEAPGGAHRDLVETARHVDAAIVRHLEALRGRSAEALRRDRFERFRRLGVVGETGPAGPANPLP